MRSTSARTLIASLVLIGVLLPSRAAGQESPEVEVRRLSNLWLCPMPVTGLSPGAVQDHIDALRSELSNERAEPTASGACFNPFVIQFEQPGARQSRLFQRLRERPKEPTPHRDPFGLRDSLPREFRLPADSLPFHLLPPALDP